jgi:hypothetical protein
VCLEREGVPGHKGAFAYRSNQSLSWNSGNLRWWGQLRQGFGRARRRVLQSVLT